MLFLSKFSAARLNFKQSTTLIPPTIFTFNSQNYNFLVLSHVSTVMFCNVWALAPVKVLTHLSKKDLQRHATNSFILISCFVLDQFASSIIDGAELNCPPIFFHLAATFYRR